MLYFVFVDGEPVFGTSNKGEAEARQNEELTKIIKQTAADNDLKLPEDEERAMEQSDCPCHIYKIKKDELKKPRKGMSYHCHKWMVAVKKRRYMKS